MAAKTLANPNQSVGAIAILLIMASFALVYYVFAPQLVTARNEQAAAQAKLDGLNTDIKTLETAKNDMGKAMDDLTAKGVDFATLRNNYPLTESMPDVYLQVEEVIRANPTLKKLDYQIGQPVVGVLGAGAHIPITLTATGTYGELKNLLIGLETNIRPFILTQIGFAGYTATTDEKDIPAGAYVLTLTGHTLTEKLSASYASTTPSK
ncbi:hypothetical protein BH11PAT4_BH11PAT4_3280 [soil metagenome]